MYETQRDGMVRELEHLRREVRRLNVELKSRKTSSNGKILPQLEGCSRGGCNLGAPGARKSVVEVAIRSH